MKYVIYLKNQSEKFSKPQILEAINLQELGDAIIVADTYDFKIIGIEKVIL